MQKTTLWLLILAALLFGGGCTQGQKKEPRIDEGKICHQDVPFIRMGPMAYYDMIYPKTRSRAVSEVFKHQYFNDEALEEGTPYLTVLAKRSDARSALIIRHRGSYWVLVRAFVLDASSNRAKVWYGLIPYSEYDAYLRSIGR